MSRALLIMGPTASGKSALAKALAVRLDGEIVNADAAQVYRELRVLTARPSAEDCARAPHHLYGHVDAASGYSVGKWLAEAAPLIADIAARGRTPIVVGGAGLYFKALTEGLVDAPAGDAEIRKALLRRLAADGPQTLYAELARLDPDAARALGPRDGVRILRALEVWEATGASILALREASAPLLRSDDWVGAALWPDRAWLYPVIEARLRAMVEAGAMDEVRALMAAGLDPSLPAMKTLGAPWLMAHLRGEITLERAIARAQQDTRRYAKRQYTWIRGQMRAWRRVEPTDLETRLEDVFALMRGVDPDLQAN